MQPLGSRRHRWLRIGSIAALGILTLALIVIVVSNATQSSDHTEEVKTEYAPTENGLADAVRRFNTAFVTDNVEQGYELLSEDCRKAVSQAEWRGQMVIAMGLLRASGDEPKIDEIRVRNVTDQRGEAAIDQSVGDNHRTGEWETWLYEDGGWRSTSCKLADFGRPGASGGTLPPEFSDLTVVPSTTTAG